MALATIVREKGIIIKMNSEICGFENLTAMGPTKTQRSVTLAIEK